MAKATKLPERATEILSSASGERQQYQGNGSLLWMVPWKQFGFNYCGVYLIGPVGRWPIKIGISQHAALRVHDMQTAHWQQITCHHYWICENFRRAREVELRSHDLLKGAGLHMHGEWFDIQIGKAIELIEYAAQTMNVELAGELPKTHKFADVHEFIKNAAPRDEKRRQNKRKRFIYEPDPGPEQLSEEELNPWGAPQMRLQKW